MSLEQAASNKKATWAVVGLGTLLRFLYIIWFHPPEKYVYADMDAYRAVAMLQAQGSNDPVITVWHGLLTHLLSFVIRIFGSPAPFAWFHLTVSVITLLLVAKLASRFLSPKLALLATFLQAIDFVQVNFAGLYMGETLAGFFLMICLLVALAWKESPEKLGYLAVSGICLGLAAMSREYILMTLFPLAFWSCGRRPTKVALARVACLSIGVLIGLSPHLWSHYQRTGQLSPGTSRSSRYLAYAWSFSFVQFCQPEGQGWSSSIYDVNHVIHPRGEVQVELHPAVTQNKSYWHGVLLHELKSHPKIFLYKAQHPILSWLLIAWPTLDETGLMRYACRGTHWLFFLVLFPLYLLQFGSGLRSRQEEVRLMNLILLAYLLMCYLGHGQASYRVPYQPLLILLGCYQIGRVEDMRKTLAKAFVIVLLAFSVCWGLAQPVGWTLRQPVPRVMSDLLVEGPVLKRQGAVLGKAGDDPVEVLEALGPPVTEWNEAAYVEAWHYNLGSRRLRVDISPEGLIEGFVLVESSSARFFPPDELMR